MAGRDEEDLIYNTRNKSEQSRRDLFNKCLSFGNWLDDSFVISESNRIWHIENHKINNWLHTLVTAWICFHTCYLESWKNRIWLALTYNSGIYVSSSTFLLTGSFHCNSAWWMNEIVCMFPTPNQEETGP